MAQVGWEERLTRIIAGEVRRHRLARNLSAQKLADRCEELGFEVPRSVIANLENGRRESVSVAELLMLAAALDVAPVQLVAALGDEAVELFPGRRVAAWLAALWFCGWGKLREARPGRKSYSLAGTADGLEVQWDDGGVVPLFLEHQRLVADLQEGGLEPGWAVVGKARRGVIQQIRRIRQELRELRVSPPPLPADLGREIDLEDASDGPR